MLNLHISFSFFALAIVAGVILLRTLHARRIALLRANALRARALQPVVAMRAKALR